MKIQPAWIILGLSLVVVTGRTMVAAQAGVSRSGRNSDARSNPGPDPKLAAASRLDSLLASMDAPARSPLLPPVQRYIPGPTKVTKEPPPEVIPPRVVLLMQDGQSTLVQIEVNGQSSGRMTVGSRFQGWTIESISAGGIAVTNGTERFVLPRP
jgi:hypothetical protein